MPPMGGRNSWAYKLRSIVAREHSRGGAPNCQHERAPVAVQKEERNIACSSKVLKAKQNPVTSTGFYFKSQAAAYLRTGSPVYGSYFHSSTGRGWFGSACGAV